MRILTEYELDLVAGGTSSSDYWDEFMGYPGYSPPGGGGGASGWYWVAVPGSNYLDGDGHIVVVANGGYWAYSGGTAGNTPSTGSGGSSGSVETTYPDARDTPCVETNFVSSSATTDRVNNAALAAANEIASQNQNKEWGAFIYELDGVVHYTAPFSDNNYGKVTFNTAIVPDGAKVLGIIHSHPDQYGVDDRTPSDHDWDVLYAALAGKSGGGITIDANLLMYIFSSEDGKTRVYDNTDKGTSQRTQVTCAL